MQIARLGDTSSHGGTIVSSCQHTKADGKLIARIGDMHSCPIQNHGVTSIQTGSTTIKIENQYAAISGVSITGCGATITSGSPDTST